MTCLPCVRLQQEFPLFGVGVRLCKRWVSAHMLAGHVREEAVELMVAHLCLHPHPFIPPRYQNSYHQYHLWSIAEEGVAIVSWSMYIDRCLSTI